MTTLRLVVAICGFAVLIAVATVFGLGALTSKQFETTVSVDINRPADEVWAVLSDPGQSPTWSTDITSATKTADGNWKLLAHNNTEAVFRYVKTGERTMTAEMLQAKSPVKGIWTMSVLAKDAGRCVVTDHAALEIDSAWLRFITKYLVDLPKTEQSQLNDLKKAMEKRPAAQK